MQIYVGHDYQVNKVYFCCGRMSRDFLLGRIKTRDWTLLDLSLNFYIGGTDRDVLYSLYHCPNCGAKIETIMED